MPAGEVHFVSFDAKLQDRQPKFILACQIVTMSRSGARPVSIAVDIADRSSATIMQAEPKCEPFIGGSQGLYRTDLRIELPPSCSWLVYL